MNETTQEEGAIFEAARGLPEGQRASYLEKTCGADTQLRQRLETRLAARLHSGQTTAIPKIDNDETVDAPPWSLLLLFPPFRRKRSAAPLAATNCWR